MARQKRFTSKGRWWTIRLRHTAGWSANADNVFLGFNTLKFMSYEAALAWCRKGAKSPADFVICLTEFTAKDVEVREIKYDAQAQADRDE
jgi:hypothetical protein